MSKRTRQSNLKARRGIWSTLYRYRSEYAFVSPFFIIFLLFGMFPLCYSITLSFVKWNATKPWDFVGLGNYLTLIRDPVFWESLWNVVFIFLANVPIMTLAAIVLAVILNSELVRIKDLFRVTYLLPYVTSVLAVSVVFYVLFDDSTGLVNGGLRLIGLKGVQWLTSTTFSKISIVILATWKWVGYNMIIALAGLQSIDPEVYDAARIDGSSWGRTLFRITIPLLAPVVSFLLIMSTIGTFNMFTEPYMLTNGGPGYSSLTLILYLYRVSFKFFNLGYGSAIAVVTFILILIPSMIQVRYMTRREKAA